MLERLVGVFGPERLMWGSDWPWIDRDAYEVELSAMSSLPFLGKDGRDWMFARTAARVFGVA
jgi:predicted TIM-barrel fold metal-dependent hydrolase